MHGAKYFMSSVSSVSLDVFQSTHFFVYSYWFVAFLEYLLNFLIIVIVVVIIIIIIPRTDCVLAVYLYVCVFMVSTFDKIKLYI